MSEDNNGNVRSFVVLLNNTTREYFVDIVAIFCTEAHATGAKSLDPMREKFAHWKRHNANATAEKHWKNINNGIGANNWCCSRLLCAINRLASLSPPAQFIIITKQHLLLPAGIDRRIEFAGIRHHSHQQGNTKSAQTNEVGRWCETMHCLLDAYRITSAATAVLPSSIIISLTEWMRVGYKLLDAMLR